MPLMCSPGPVAPAVLKLALDAPKETLSLSAFEATVRFPATTGAESTTFRLIEGPQIVREAEEQEHIFRLVAGGIQQQLWKELFEPQADVSCTDSPTSLVHAVLYFLPPHGLRNVDVQIVQQLSERIPVVVCIAKADTMTPEEVSSIRTALKAALNSPQDTLYRAQSAALSNTWLASDGAVFAVAASQKSATYPVASKSGIHFWPVREYSSGPVYLWDPAVSETLALRTFLVTHEREKLQHTAMRQYQRYRAAVLPALVQFLHAQPASPTSVPSGGETPCDPKSDAEIEPGASPGEPAAARRPTYVRTASLATRHNLAGSMPSTLAPHLRKDALQEEAPSRYWEMKLQGQLAIAQAQVRALQLKTQQSRGLAEELAALKEELK